MLKLPVWPKYTNEEIKAVSNILVSGKVNYWTGNETKEFEKEFSHWTGSDYSIALANGTLALELSLKALNIKTGDEVIVTPRSFIASASSVLSVGGKPVLER